MQITDSTAVDFLLAIHNVENKFKNSINLMNAHKNQGYSKLITALIENAKYANKIGRNKRAWAFCILANRLLTKVKK